MKLFAVAIALLAFIVAPLAAGQASVPVGAVVYVEASDFGQAIQAAILKKKVPVQVTTNKEKADYFIEETSKTDKEGSAERVTKVLAFGAFAGNGKSFESSVTMTNKEGVVVFAQNSKKDNVRSAAEEVAKKLGEFVKKAK